MDLPISISNLKPFSPKESVYSYLNEPAPVRRLTQGLCLTSHPNDRVENSEKKLHEFVCVYLNPRMTAALKGAARDWTYDLLVNRQALTTRPSCSPCHKSPMHYQLSYQRKLNWINKLEGKCLVLQDNTTGRDLVMASVLSSIWKSIYVIRKLLAKSTEAHIHCSQ